MKRPSVFCAVIVFLLSVSTASALETTAIYKQTQDYLVTIITMAKPTISYSEYKSIKKEWEEFVKKLDKSKDDVAKMKNQLRKIDPDYIFPLDFFEDIAKNTPKFEELWPYPGAKAASGAGFFINHSGMVTTNHHVIAMPGSTVRVLFKGKYYSAKVVGKDAFSDLAILRAEGIDPAKYTPVALGDTDALAVGQRVVIAGNPRGLLGSLSEGIVSGLNRSLGALGPGASWPGMIQTDASVDQGNSGGPMIDKNTGNVVGVVNATIQSFGFAVPVNALKRFVKNVLLFGKARWGMLGADISDVPVSGIAKEIAREEYGLPEVTVDHGALVRKVRENSPAQKAGLKDGDVIVKVGGQPVNGSSALILAVAMSEPGARGKITVVRGDKEMVLTIVWGERPDNF